MFTKGFANGCVRASRRLASQQWRANPPPPQEAERPPPMPRPAPPRPRPAPPRPPPTPRHHPPTPTHTHPHPPTPIHTHPQPPTATHTHPPTHSPTHPRPPTPTHAHPHPPTPTHPHTHTHPHPHTHPPARPPAHPPAPPPPPAAHRPFQNTKPRPARRPRPGRASLVQAQHPCPPHHTSNPVWARASRVASKGSALVLRNDTLGHVPNSRSIAAMMRPDSCSRLCFRGGSPQLQGPNLGGEFHRH